MLFWLLKCIVPVMSKYTYMSLETSQILYVLHGVGVLLVIKDCSN